MILEWSLGRGRAWQGWSQAEGRKLIGGQGLELVPFPKLEVEALRFPLTSLDPLPPFSTQSPMQRLVVY